MPDRVGQQIGNYRIVRLLGQGGVADVYLGEHRYLKSAAALKMRRLSLSEEETQRFLEEAQTLVRLRHTHIVCVLDYAIEGDTPVIIMDYIPGGSLRQRHPRGTCLPVPLTVDYVGQIAVALQYAHNHHIIHRDVKPENILLDSDERLVLSDFGLALLAPSSNLLSIQELAGTLPYVAPEQVRGKPGFASDQYALGVVTYEWLTGRRPFEGSPWQLLEQHLTAVPPPLRERCPDLPVPIEQVVLRALAKNPQERYVSVSAFAQALAHAAQESSPQDEDSQSTAPLLAGPGSSALALDRFGSQRHLPGSIFLLAARGDERVAGRLAADLKSRGLQLCNDPAVPISLPEQEEAMRQAIRAAEWVVVVVTPQTRSSRLIREQLHLAQMYQRPLVLVWMAGEAMAAMLLDQTWEPFLPLDTVDARGERYQTALDELLACLREQTRVPSDEATVQLTAPQEPRNPYKGLRAFREIDALDFFGRDALLEEMVGQLKGMLVPTPRGAAARLLPVVGPSGSGKSSVVLAGLLPRLRAGVLSGSQEWVYLEPIVPGARPLEALALTLASQFPDRQVKAIGQDLQDDSARRLHWLATQLAQGPDRRVVLIIDQFEELFTQTMTEEERSCFIDLLVTAATEVAGPVLVILTLRADFSDRPMRYPSLYRLMHEHLVAVLPMDIYELRATIEEPAALPDVRLTFEGNLVGDLLFELQGQVGALPLLEFTLERLFQQREGRTLTMAAYRQIGGVKGALAKHAESTYTCLLSDEHRSFARVLFMRLVNLGMTEQDTTRRRATLSELTLSNAKQAALLREVTDTFIAARLLTTTEQAGVTTVEVSHEALLAEWTRLSNWLREGREDIHLQQEISSDVEVWEERGRPKDRLYHRSQLKEARAWARRNKPSKQEVAFLRASTHRQLQFVVSMIMLFLLLVSTAGAAIRFYQLFSLLSPGLVSVTSLSDDGPGSLRAAIKSAAAGSTISFAPNVKGTIFLGSADLVFSKNLTIQGPGAGNLTISGGNSGHTVRVFEGNTVTISGLSFKNSNTGKAGEGFLVNDGTLTLDNTTVSGNMSSNTGGGIYNVGTLLLINSTVSSNSARYGGGIYNDNGGALTVINSTISGNKAEAVAQDAAGGGILDSGQLTLSNSTVSGNATTGTGGGIDVFGGQATITFCTIYANTAQDGGGFSIEDNGTQQSHVKMGNSIVAGNRALNGADTSGTFTSDGYNLIQQASLLSGASAPTDLISVSPNVGPLQDNGGPTKMHALLPGSPAIDRIPRNACHLDTIPKDQRGVQRPQGSACDIGAYEYKKSPPH